MPLSEGQLASLQACASSRPPTRLVLSLPDSIGASRSLALLVSRRTDGAILAVPEGTVLPEAYTEAEASGFVGELGPQFSCTVPLGASETTCDFVDFSSTQLCRSLERVTARSPDALR